MAPNVRIVLISKGLFGATRAELKKAPARKAGIPLRARALARA